jgi:hypothetical protein
MKSEVRSVTIVENLTSTRSYLRHARKEIFRHNRVKMLTAEDIKEYFYGSQVLIGILFFVSVFLIRGGLRDSPSQFNSFEDDANKDAHLFPSIDAPSSQPKKEKAKILQLTGIRIDGAPHEILGVKAGADEKSIQKAYRDLMKRYHPDLVGPPGSREWTDAQKLAEAINLAKEEMIRSARSRRSS